MSLKTVAKIFLSVVILNNFSLSFADNSDRYYYVHNYSKNTIVTKTEGFSSPIGPKSMSNLFRFNEPTRLVYTNEEGTAGCVFEYSISEEGTTTLRITDLPNSFPYSRCGFENQPPVTILKVYKAGSLSNS